MIVDAITAKVQQLRENYEKEGFEIIERPGPEHFPFEVGYRGHYRPAMLARRGDENYIFEVRDPRRTSLEPLMERMEEIRKHAGWRFFLVTTEDVVPHDAPGLQGEPPPWPDLERRAEQALSFAAAGAPPIALLLLWPSVEGVLRKIALSNGIPVDLLSAPFLITALYDQGFISMDAYESLLKAVDIHRSVVHGYDAPADQVADAVRAAADVLHEMLPKPVERAA
ncbi:MAG TPA: hypothetical protein VEX86_10985 [Longimicrobium sp.]|nr:hypothetical protein [Longimicrobium sp.]